MKNEPPKLTITFENHGRKQSSEMFFDASLPEIMLAFCNLLVANGWSGELIEELFNDEESTGNNSPWEWNIS